MNSTKTAENQSAVSVFSVGSNVLSKLSLRVQPIRYVLFALLAYGLTLSKNKHVNKEECDKKQTHSYDAERLDLLLKEHGRH